MDEILKKQIDELVKWPEENRWWTYKKGKDLVREWERKNNIYLEHNEYISHLVYIRDKLDL